MFSRDAKFLDEWDSAVAVADKVPGVGTSYNVGDLCFDFQGPNTDGFFSGDWLEAAGCLLPDRPIESGATVVGDSSRSVVADNAEGS